MEKGFREWMESMAAGESIMGVFSGGDDLTPSEREHLLSRRSTDFSSEIIRRVKGLGAVRAMGRRARVALGRSLDDGATVSDIVKMARAGTIGEGRHESEMDSMNRALDRRFERELRRPTRMKSSRSQVRP